MRNRDTLASPRERRTAHRYEVPLPLKVCLDAEDGSEPIASPVFETYTNDISTTGLAFTLDRGFNLGSSIKCVLRLAGNSPGDPPVQLRLKGKIVRVDRLEQNRASDRAGRVVIGATIEEYLLK